MKATASWPNGRTLTWEDGELSGSRALIVALEPAARANPFADVTPEGPTVATAKYESDPQAFRALARLVNDYGATDPHWDLSDDFPVPTAPPEPTAA
jgi:hypothetical protein